MKKKVARRVCKKILILKWNNKKNSRRDKKSLPRGRRGVYFVIIIIFINFLFLLFGSPSFKKVKKTSSPPQILYLKVFSIS
jgi:hypothetical protein